jgi:hypothetical protein
MDIDIDSTRLLKLRLQQPDGGTVDIELLRDLLWMEWHNAYEGNRIWLDLEELGAEGWAEVLADEPCPAISEGDGPLVTGKFIHSAANVIDLYVTGLDEPIGVTANHPFWSETRQDFIPAGDLAPGEELLSETGERITVLRAEHRSEPQTVYNLEVDGEHVYAVTEAGVLVHNMCHGNSILSQKANHGYAIINKHTGEIYKFGISGGKISAAGASYRATRQLGTIASKNGVLKADLQIVTFKGLGNRWHAVQWEKGAVGFFRNKLGHKLPNNILPKGEWP